MIPEEQDREEITPAVKIQCFWMHWPAVEPPPKHLSNFPSLLFSPWPTVFLTPLKFWHTQPNQAIIRLHYTAQNTMSFIISFPGSAKLTADDEVGVEDAQGGLVGTLLVVDCGWDDEAERDAGDALQHDQNYDQHQGAFIRHLQKRKTERGGQKSEKR